jgi:hypothetical protein
MLHVAGPHADNAGHKQAQRRAASPAYSTTNEAGRTRQFLLATVVLNLCQGGVPISTSPLDYIRQQEVTLGLGGIVRCIVL